MSFRAMGIMNVQSYGRISVYGWISSWNNACIHSFAGNYVEKKKQQQ